MQKGIKNVLLVTSFLFGSFVITTTVDAKEFKDVRNTDTAYSAIDNLSDRSIISGYADGMFRPEGTVTRGQASKFISLTLGLPDVKPSSATFSDVAATHPFASYIKNLSDRGIISGYSDNTFRPNDTITRAQISKILVTAFDMKDTASGTLPYRDVNTSNWYTRYIQTLYKNQVFLTTEPTKFLPDNLVTRREMAKFIFESEAAIQPISKEEQELQEIVAKIDKFNLGEVEGTFMHFPKLPLPEGVEIEWDLVTTLSPDSYTKTSNGIYFGSGFPTGTPLRTYLQATLKKKDAVLVTSLPVTITKLASTAVLQTEATLNGSLKHLVFTVESKEPMKSIDWTKLSVRTNLSSNDYIKLVNYTQSESLADGKYSISSSKINNRYVSQVTIDLTLNDYYMIAGSPGFGNPQHRQVESDYLYLESGFVSGSLTTAANLTFLKPVALNYSKTAPHTPRFYWAYDSNGKQLMGRAIFGGEMTISIPDYSKRVVFADAVTKYNFDTNTIEIPITWNQEVIFTEGLPATIFIKDDAWIKSQ